MDDHTFEMSAVAQPLIRRRAVSLDRRLVSGQAVSGDHMMRALVLRQHLRAPLSHILLTEGWASEDQVLDALAGQHGLQRADLSGHVPNARLLARRPARFWLRHCALPWLQLGRCVVVAIAHPERLSRLRSALEECFRDIQLVLASEAQITALLGAHFRSSLAQAASCCVAPRLSCRTMRESPLHTLPAALFGAMLGLAVAAPLHLFTAFCLIALLTLLLFTGFKLFGFAACLAERAQPPPAPHPPPAPRRLPRISVLVPLYKEADISKALLRRLCKLTYPRALLEVVLVLEEHDAVTRAAVRCADLPSWIRVVEVPEYGALKTKPRAMNYALNFCRGEIIGVWDAEDAPEADQLERVAEAFGRAPPQVACVQGALDYYNPHDNWIARCFTLEYASWFRVVLPGIARLGLVVPLGGTTMFVRRSVLERLGGWDAYNVTEDADLGVRLARAGYRTEMLPAATYEEANCRPWPWIRQRSRWLKGFMATYLVHMRTPRLLLRQLGWRRFLGFQAFFLGTIGQFLLAPFLWSFWLIALGLPHPSAALLPEGMLGAAAAALVFFELLGFAVSAAAAAAAGRPRLALWAPAMMLYFPMGAVAALKALYELLFSPFFWDKTAHGTHTAPAAPLSETGL
ncbi:glycosyltransferase [Roseobacteraceae bacterium NS-SX3]